MRILIVGTGGREHALLWKLAADAPGAELLCTAGNAGMEELAEPLALDPTDVPGVVAAARRHAVDLVVVGPEAPLAAGLVDAVTAAGLRAFGPRRAAAEIETSKAFAKAFLRRHGIPTADFRTFTHWLEAEAWLGSRDGSVVVKASGLAGGKGAVVCADRGEALRTASAMLRDGAFGEAGREIVVEERLRGPELSVIAVTDGETVCPLLAARDHKRAHDGDRGPNTGGMGAVAPVPDVSAVALEEIAERILQPAVAGLAAEGRPFRGALYAGLMLTGSGPQVIEFNARFGDPEAEAILPLLDSSLLDLLLACAEPAPAHGRALGELEPIWHPGASCCVVAASDGYPGAYERDLPIRLEPADAGHGPSADAVVFHAGTARRGGRLVTAGGRVLAVTGRGPDADAAREAAYARLRGISFPGMFYRSDIGVAAPD